MLRSNSGAKSKPYLRARAKGVSSSSGWLVIGGEKALGEVLAQQMKLVASDVTVVVLKNTGHWVLEENPKETTEALVKFL